MHAGVEDARLVVEGEGGVDDAAAGVFGAKGSFFPKEYLRGAIFAGVDLRTADRLFDSAEALR